jgi:hypothetical protein
LLAVVVFRSFYGSSEPGTTSHEKCNPVESVAPPFQFKFSTRGKGQAERSVEYRSKLQIAVRTLDTRALN